MRLFSLAFLAAAALCGPALASSEEAWETFRTEVRDSCLALAEPLGTAVVEVSPFGSENYGVALVTLETEGAVERRVCVFDKKTKAVELAEPFAP